MTRGTVISLCDRTGNMVRPWIACSWAVAVQENPTPRLRSYHYEHPAICGEAADEIERLRAALEEIAGLWPLKTQHEHYVAMLKVGDIARAALTAAK
jgi:hypothetical protein